MKRPVLMILAGELSGDLHAAAVLRELRRRRPDLECFGTGGDALAAAGLEVRGHVRDLAVLGLTDVLRRLPFFYALFRDLERLARARRPDAVLLVDYPGFNLRFAARARAMGLKVIYYICPQVWAWNRGRIARMARDVDRLLAIFPFEADLFRGRGLRVEFVGHPLVAPTAAARAAPEETLPWPGEPRLALLPGSRYHEIERILPVLWLAAGRADRRLPGAGWLIAAPTAEAAGWVQASLERLRRKPGGPARAAVTVGRTRQVLRQARAAFVASGTATIEAALMRCPMLVVYRTSWLTYGLGRLLIRVPYLGMVNIVAGERLCPEFIQHRARPEPLAEALARIAADGSARQGMLEGLDRVARALGDPRGAERAAAAIAEEL